jgi:hypothetical protein
MISHDIPIISLFLPVKNPTGQKFKPQPVARPRPPDLGGERGGVTFEDVFRSFLWQEKIMI